MFQILTPRQWKIIILGVVIVILGFILMSGGRQDDPQKFNPAEIYSPRRITLAPITISIGYLIIAIGVARK